MAQQVSSGGYAHTFAAGSNVEDLASRAREIGIQHRAALQRRDEVSGAGIIISSRLHVAVLAARGLEEEDEVDEEGMEMRRPRLPSWLEEAERAVATRREGPHEPLARRSGFTLMEAFFASIRSAVGPAVLYMPKGFQEGGLVFSFAMLLLSYTLFGTAAMRLLESWRKGRKSYAALMGRAYGKRGTAIVRVTIVAQQCGICLTYFVFVATNARQLFAFAFPDRPPPSLALFCLVQVLAYAPLSCVRNVQNFAYTNLAANVLILYSLLVLTSFASLKVSHEAQPLPLFNPNAFYLFIGTSAFIYEGSAALVVPLQEAVRDDLQKDFAPLYLKTAGGIVLVYIMFGIVNWAAYGDRTETVLTVNLPDGNWKASVQLAYLVAVVFTFPLQLFPAIQILKSAVHKLESLHRRHLANRPSSSDSYERISSIDDEKTHPGKRRLEGNIARAFLVLGLSAVSIFEVHSLDKLVALVGGLLGIPLAFVYPLAIHLQLVPEAPRIIRLTNIIFILIGLGLAIACTGVTIATW
ncbi:hypothetical protein CTAYLR_001901 [Chrysophaeum taylorii]|uniref:Amino acid transporter transmembrane domain-containing protein n=1 Tax=Chrysophaeum taylorii TaxID=2483200 RepID=A0AAD7UAK5_9STRA|nr:hypothetical protein CTAYLR_001901 [Chrysophaeum taylorii]